jgi:hypothetical protein
LAGGCGNLSLQISILGKSNWAASRFAYVWVSGFS